MRRRRWYRKCRLSTSGPWHELGTSKICDVALQPMPAAAAAGDAPEPDAQPISVWAIAHGDALWRRGVTRAQPSGQQWEHVAAPQPLVAISCASWDRVWAVGKAGGAFVRCGVTELQPQGEGWKPLEAPTGSGSGGGVGIGGAGSGSGNASGSALKQISAGRLGVWALDAQGRLVVRRGRTPAFDEGTHWQVLPNVLGDGPHTEVAVAAGTQPGWRSVSVGAEVWAVANSGQVCRRCGITAENPAGTGWMLGIPVSETDGMAELREVAIDDCWFLYISGQLPARVGQWTGLDWGSN